MEALAVEVVAAAVGPVEPGQEMMERRLVRVQAQVEAEVAAMAEAVVEAEVAGPGRRMMDRRLVQEVEASAPAQHGGLPG